MKRNRYLLLTAASLIAAEALCIKAAIESPYAVWLWILLGASLVSFVVGTYIVEESHGQEDVAVKHPLPIGEIRVSDEENEAFAIAQRNSTRDGRNEVTIRMRNEETGFDDVKRVSEIIEGRERFDKLSKFADKMMGTDNKNVVEW